MNPFKQSEPEAPAAPKREPIILSPWAWWGNANLVGKVYGHPKFPDGRTIVTGSLRVIDEQTGVAETRNHLYWLVDKKMDPIEVDAQLREHAQPDKAE